MCVCQSMHILSLEVVTAPCLNLLPSVGQGRLGAKRVFLCFHLIHLHDTRESKKDERES